MTRYILCAALLFVAGPARAETNAELKEQVRQTEIAFAKTMADRNPAAFGNLSDSQHLTHRSSVPDFVLDFKCT